jgi:hypothetical protein
MRKNKLSWLSHGSLHTSLRTHALPSHPEKALPSFSLTPILTRTLSGTRARIRQVNEARHACA